MIRLGTWGSYASETAGRVRPCLRELPARGPVVDDDPVAGDFVRLYEDDVALAGFLGRSCGLSADEDGGGP